MCPWWWWRSWWLWWWWCPGQTSRDATADFGATAELQVEIKVPDKQGWHNAATSREGTVLIGRLDGAMRISRSIARPAHRGNFTLNGIVDHYVAMGFESTEIKVRVRYVGEATWAMLVWDPNKKRSGRGADKQGGWTGHLAFDG